MEHRKISSVMTPAARVVTVPVDAGYKEIATLLGAHEFSAVPVVDAEQRVLGVVSEDDLLAKESQVETEPQDRHRLPFAGRAERRILHKAGATTARELMTSPPVTIGDRRDIVDAARMMLERHVKQLVVTDADGRLQGVVSRRDVLKVFARTDEDIRHEITEDVIRGMFWIDPHVMNVRVERGVVHIRGRVETRGQAELICGVVGRTDGVVAVVNELESDHDDTSGKTGRTGPLGIFQRPLP
jgi:CBS-domain-containing membrane protein